MLMLRTLSNIYKQWLALHWNISIILLQKVVILPDAASDINGFVVDNEIKKIKAYIASVSCGKTSLPAVHIQGTDQVDSKANKTEYISLIPAVSYQNIIHLFV